MKKWEGGFLNLVIICNQSLSIKKAGICIFVEIKQI